MKVTYLGTTMLLFDDGNDQILFDCHVTRPSLTTCIFGTFTTDKAVADRVIKDHKIDRLRGIFVSHSHHDHVLDAPYFANRCHADIYGSPSALNVARGGSVPEERLHEFHTKASFTIGSFKITVLPSIHSKAHWYNNDLGQTIDEPVIQPAKKKAYKEGGSYDFFIEHSGKTYLIRPSYNFLPGQLDGISADVLFLGIGGLSKDKKPRQREFFRETVEKVNPKLVIPVHWDHFFVPLYGPVKGQPKLMENTENSLRITGNYCTKRNISFVVQMPRTQILL